ncbi:hypothetical protein SAMN04490193_1450 [Pseudomonas marginalis]|nr:hypothetical protein SAMN04490193_1450 [Pseudomonas marginalis]
MSDLDLAAIDFGKHTFHLHGQDNLVENYFARSFHDSR